MSTKEITKEKCPLVDGRYTCCALDCHILNAFAVKLIKKYLYLHKDVNKSKVGTDDS